MGFKLRPDEREKWQMLANSKQELFCREYVARGFGDGVEAYKTVYQPPETRSIKKAVASVLSSPGVMARVEELRGMIESTVVMSAEAILREWTAIATADYSELDRVHDAACRYCHGIDGNYQWKSEREFAEAMGDFLSLTESLRKEKDRPNSSGGFGYSHMRHANKHCVECGGAGDPLVHITPTHELSPVGRKIYLGAEMTKYGIKIHKRDPDAALLNIAKALGVVKPEAPAPGGTPPSAGALPPALPEDPIEASRKYAEWMKSS